MAQEQKSLKSWIKARRHEDVVLPSGTKVDIELPNLSALLKAGAIPNQLVDVALGILSGKDPEINTEMVIQSVDFQEFIVSQMVVNPEITPEDVKLLPAEDVDMLTEFSTRSRDIDAVGHHLAGLETQLDHAGFRQ